MPKVRDVMTAGIITIPASASFSDAARVMRDEDIGALPVLDGDQFVGIVTDRDIVVRGLVDHSPDATIGSIITAEVAWLSPDDDAKDAQNRMADNDVRRLPVIEAGRLVGMVSVGDLAVRANAKLAGQVIEQTGPAE